MNRLNREGRSQVLAALVEGTSIRAVARMTGVARNTIMRFLVEAGAACAVYQNEHLRNLPCQRIQCDEIWSYIGKKDKNIPAGEQGKFGIGSVWTWTALDAETKLVCSWMIGTRDAAAAYDFMQDLASRLSNRVQLTTDGHTAYLSAVEHTFGSDIDYAMLVKIYGESPEAEKRYSPAECIGCERKKITGTPDPKHISTSYVERQNLTMRMHMRSFTRLTNAFSKKLENHIAAVALHFMFYNFVRIHQTLRVTPAMAAGVTNHVWEISDIVRLVEEREEVERKDKEAERHARYFNTQDSTLSPGKTRKFAR